jgi:excinuclease UvrABC ATPase subunit
VILSEKQKFANTKSHRRWKSRQIKEHLAALNHKWHQKASKIARETVALYLLEHPCVDCGETDIVVLEFDHVRGQKKNAISNMITTGLSVKRIMAEIKKCEVVCANDHRRRTARRAKHFRYVRTP